MLEEAQPSLGVTLAFSCGIARVFQAHEILKVLEGKNTLALHVRRTP